MDLILSIEAPSLKNNGVYYTDSNGLFEMRRQKSDVFENDVYPVTSFIHLADEEQKLHLKVFSDRSQGGFSIFDGVASLYVQRSAKVDDHKGNPEVLDVTETIHTEHYVLNYVEGTGDYDATNAEIVNRLNVHYEQFSLRGDQTEASFQAAHASDIDPDPKYLFLRFNTFFVDQSHLLVRF